MLNTTTTIRRSPKQQKQLHFNKWRELHADAVNGSGVGIIGPPAHASLLLGPACSLVPLHERAGNEAAVDGGGGNGRTRAYRNCESYSINK